MLRRFSINFALFSMLLDVGAVALSLWFATFCRPLLNRFNFVETTSNLLQTPLALYLLFPAIWLLIYLTISIYDGKKYLRVVDEFGALLLGNLVASISSAGILYLSYREISRALFLLFVTLAYLLSLGWRVLARLFFRAQRPQTEKIRRALVVGSGPIGKRVSVQLQQANLQDLIFAGFVDDATDGPNPPQVLGRTAQLKELVLVHQISDVIIALPYSAYAQLGEIVRQIEELPVNVWVALGFFDLALYETAIEDFAGIPMLDLRASAIDDYQRLIKRAFDLVFGSLGLLLVLPFLGLIALLILLEDGRPVLFRQERAGENGRVFEMLKFRTMLREAEKLRSQVEQLDENGNLIHKRKDDPRVTRLGRFLRRYSLDELPQLFNIIAGTMSIVGPRPEMPFLVEKYQPWQRKRFAVPPGLTGWWQVNGRSDRPMHLHTEDDLYYIQNYSIWLDLQIIARTIWVVLIGKGSY